jgi:acetate kinase
MDDKQIKHMVERFLNWPLPNNFAPDGGISFERYGNKGTEHQYERRPVGTNLLDYAQAEAMVRHMIEGMSNAKAE